MFHRTAAVLGLSCLALGPSVAEAQTTPPPATYDNIYASVTHDRGTVTGAEFQGKYNGVATLTIQGRRTGSTQVWNPCTLRSTDEAVLLKIQQAITESRGRVEVECAAPQGVAPGRTIVVDLSSPTNTTFKLQVYR